MEQFTNEHNERTVVFVRKLKPHRLLVRKLVKQTEEYA
jgi:hypothetical protein